MTPGKDNRTLNLNDLSYNKGEYPSARKHKVLEGMKRKCKRIKKRIKDWLGKPQTLACFPSRRSTFFELGIQCAKLTNLVLFRHVPLFFLPNSLLPVSCSSSHLSIFLENSYSPFKSHGRIKFSLFHTF